MIKYLKLPFQFDVAAMQKEVTELGAQSWKMHYNKKHYEGDWTVLSLRSPGGDPGNIISIHATASTAPSFQYKNTELLNHSPYLLSLLEQFRCEKTMVRLMKLNAGANIKEHTDHDMNFESGEARIHIPVVTNSEVDFFIANEKLHLSEGECWYLNLNLPHRVNNKGNIDRIHLVIDCVVNDWLTELFNNEEARKVEYEPEEQKERSREESLMIIDSLKRLNTETSLSLAKKMEEEL